MNDLRRSATAAIVLVVLAAACGSVVDDADVSTIGPDVATEAANEAGTVPSAGTPPTASAAQPADRGTRDAAAAAELPTTIGEVVESATVTETADRLTDGIVVAWIGGSEVVLEDRSLPEAVSARVPTVAGRELILVADTLIGPLPGNVRATVEAAAARDVDGLIVVLNTSWVAWGGTDRCDGISPPHAFYACVLEPPPPAVASEKLAEIEALVDAIASTGLPAYLYVIPHSAEALASPLLADLITDAEGAIAALDPGVDRVEYVGRIFTRDLDGMHEGPVFIDMVHPTHDGVARLADWLAVDLQRFWASVEW